MAYRRRIVDDVLDELLPDLAAIALQGAKGVGKTATASQRAATILSLSQRNERAAVTANLDIVTQLPTPVLVDEWQLEPSVWDRVRRAVDDDPSGGRFLLAGSAGAAPGVRIHSGAGRIVSLPLRPLAISERGLQEPTVSLRALLEGGQTDIAGTSELDLPAYTDEILRSGFPGIRDLIVERNDRATVAIEVKLSDTVESGDVRHLNWLRQQLGDRLVDRAVIYTGRFA